MGALCLRCGRCCTQFGVCVTHYDIARIQHATGLMAEDFIQAIPDQENKERSEPAILIDDELCLLILKWKELYPLKQGPAYPTYLQKEMHNSRICTFYSPAGCSIYKDRPMLCRTYPFLLSNEKLVGVRSRACPSMWVPSFDAKEQYVADLMQYTKEVEEYKELAAVWNSGIGGSLSEFIKFVQEHVLIKKI